MSVVIVGAGALCEPIAAQLRADGRSVDRAANAEALPSAGALDALVHCVDDGPPTAVETITADAWDQAMDRHLGDAFRSARAAADRLADGGCIVFVGSLIALGVERTAASEIAARAGLIGLARALALDLGQRGIRVNVVAPGPLGVSANVLRRSGTPAHVAAAVAFLCSDGAAFMTGQCLFVDGGRSLNHQPF